MASLDSLDDEFMKIEAAYLTKKAADNDAHFAKQAADLAEFEASVSKVLENKTKSLLATALAKRAALGCAAAQKPTLAFKICSAETLNSGERNISDFDGFQGLHYSLKHALPICNDEKKAEASLKGLLCEDGKRIGTDVARKLVKFRKTMDLLIGKEIVRVACGKHGKKHGGEICRVVGGYTYDETTLPSGGKYYHRYKTEFVRKLTPYEFEKVMKALGETPSSKYRTQWSIDI
jgi:hypothetical protein